MMAGFFRNNVTALAAYVPGEQVRGSGVLKLNANENPYPPSPKVLRAVRTAAKSSASWASVRPKS